ncbi:MAG: DUF1990 family protein [Planctomycetota bacterium]|nr:DUF1990 family protein [Planctomycetota bacterium]
MNVLLFGRKPPLQQWEGRSYSGQAFRGAQIGGNRDEYAREVATEAPGDPEEGGPYRRLADAIFRFDVFSPKRIEGVTPRSPLEEGDVVGVAYRVLPGLRLFFASRITHTFDEATDGLRRTGFTYRTLDGHPEEGEETFAVEKHLETGRLTVRLSSWSRPGLGPTRLPLAPRLMRKLQVRECEAALDHLASIADPVSA